MNWVDPYGLNPGATTWVGAEIGTIIGGPVGGVIGGAIGLGLGLYAGQQAWDHWFANESKSNPFKGDPGSEECTVDNDGNPKQKRKYGDDGWPSQDIDYDHDHGQGQPHVHDWTRPSGGGPPTHKDRLPGRPYKP